jgi:hypothetical protein
MARRAVLVTLLVVGCLTAAALLWTVASDRSVGWRPLQQAQLMKLTVGEDYRCCRKMGFTSCKDHAQLGCTAPPVYCMPGQVFLGTCTSASCILQQEASCYLATVTRYIDKCVLNGESTFDGCTGGKKRCEYTHFEKAYAVSVYQCDSGSTECEEQPTFTCPSM